jgi:hypothetical protein
MAVTLKGVGAVWAVGSLQFTGLVVTPITTTEAKYQSFDFERNASNAKLTNEVGDTVGEAYYDKTHSVRVTIIPSGASVAAARTNMVALLPEPGTAVTLVDPEAAASTGTYYGTDGRYSGAYIVDRARNSRSSTGFATIELEMHQNTENDCSATI